MALHNFKIGDIVSQRGSTSSNVRGYVITPPPLDPGVRLQLTAGGPHEYISVMWLGYNYSARYHYSRLEKVPCWWKA